MPMRGLKLDPEGNEVTALDWAVSLKDKRVLEIGCGDGRLTWALAGRARAVVAIDPKSEAVRAARRAMPHRLKGQVRFQVARAEDLPFHDGEFSAVVFSWSL